MKKMAGVGGDGQGQKRGVALGENLPEERRSIIARRAHPLEYSRILD